MTINVPVRSTINVLVLCTGNSARSVLAECLINRLGQGRWQAFSAGSHPTGQVNPLTIEVLGEKGFDVTGLRSKSWDEFAAPGAPALDFVFTVCDNAAGEVCPVWPGQPMTAHWGVPDPVGFVGPEAEKAAHTAEIMRMLSSRIQIFAALPMRSLDRLTLQKRLNDIGKRD